MEHLSGFVHRFVPAAQEGRGPTLLVLHGTGGDESDLIPLARSIAPHAALLSPRGQVLERGMPRFFRRIAEGVFDREDLIARTHELAGFVAEAARTYALDPAAFMALGYSNGANIAASLMLLHPDALRGGILFRAMVPLDPVPPPAPDLSGREVFLGCGRMDPLIPSAGSERLAEILRDADAQVTLHWENTGHGLSQGDVDEARRWAMGTALLTTAPNLP